MRVNYNDSVLNEMYDDMVRQYEENTYVVPDFIITKLRSCDWLEKRYTKLWRLFWQPTECEGALSHVEEERIEMDKAIKFYHPDYDNNQYSTLISEKDGTTYEKRPR